MRARTAQDLTDRVLRRQIGLRDRIGRSALAVDLQRAPPARQQLGAAGAGASHRDVQEFGFELGSGAHRSQRY